MPVATAEQRRALLDATDRAAILDVLAKAESALLPALRLRLRVVE